ncbi:MAG: hypothetical protein ABI607_15395 [Betaproteobacteria bacterium]
MQPADRQLLRGRHLADTQPRPRRNDGGFGLLAIALTVFVLRRISDATRLAGIQK